MEVSRWILGRGPRQTRTKSPLPALVSIWVRRTSIIKTSRTGAQEHTMHHARACYSRYQSYMPALSQFSICYCTWVFLCAISRNRIVASLILLKLIFGRKCRSATAKPNTWVWHSFRRIIIDRKKALTLFVFFHIRDWLALQALTAVSSTSFQIIDTLLLCPPR